MTAQERARWDELHDLILQAPSVDRVVTTADLWGHIDALHSQCVRIIQARRDGVLTAQDPT